MGMMLALALAPACGDDGAVTSDTDETDSEGTTEGPTTTPSTSNPSTTMNPSTTGMTSETDTETTGGPTTGDTETTTDTTGEPTTGDTETTGDLCGNDVVDAGEDCDGDDLDGQDCTTQGADEGTLACNDDCTFNTDGCIMYSCGNDTQEGKELCDGTDLADQTCEGLAFAGGTLACNKNCMDYDTSGCYACGDNVIGGPEVCDGTDLADETCELQGFIGGGTLACANDCSGYDTTACSATLCSTPGTVIDGSVVVLDSIVVPSFGAYVGDVDVSLDIPHFYVGDLQVDIRHVETDTRVQLLRNQCTSTDNVDGIFDQDAAAPPTCTSPVGGGMNVLPVGNLDNFDGLTDSTGTWELSVTDTFASLDDGTLAEWCVTLQPSEASPASCGDNSSQFGETCDGTDLRDATCVSEGLDGGTLACLGDCSDYDTSSCTDCGDGVAEGPEACDGADLGTATCESVGFPDGGALGCTATCTFDTSGCNAPPGDTCADPIIIDPTMLPYTDMGDTDLLADDYGYSAGVCPGEEGGWNAGAEEVVYAFTPDTDGTYTITFGDTWDSTVWVVTDCADIDNTCVAGADAEFSNDPPETIVTPLTADTTYYIMGGHWSNSTLGGGGPYTLTVSAPCFPTACDEVTCGDDGCGGTCGCADGDICVDGTCTPAAPGDTCADPIIVGALPYNDSGNTLDYTNNYGYASGVCPGETGGWGAGAEDVVYAFTPAVDGNYTITFTTTWDSTVWMVTDCANVNGSCVAGADNGNPETITANLSGGTTYYIMGSHWSNTTPGSGGAYTLDIVQN